MVRNMDFQNVYEDDHRAEAYARLYFPGTYYLAYRDLPRLIDQYISGPEAIDFGCGTGRSSRFLKKLGFRVTGVDISASMIRKALEADPEGNYFLIGEDGLSRFPKNFCDLILSVFTFDNIPTFEKKVRLFQDLKSLVKQDGGIISVVSTPEIYIHEWASFSTKDFPENRKARSGDRVKIVITDVDDARPVVDIIVSDEEYAAIYRRAGLRVIHRRRPLATGGEPIRWKSETTVAPWAIYVLKK
jgi:SAM-dependent methyltransferase